MPAIENEQRANASPVVIGGIAGVTYFVLVLSLFLLWVHFYYAGNASGPLMISKLFGVSRSSFQAGARPIFEAETPGWDGQFYYTQSNDPFLLDQPLPRERFDLISYRYQRNGLPLLAWAVSKLTGSGVTYPITYFAVSFLIVSVAFGLLVGYLRSQQISVIWALVWGIHGGVVRPMIHGLPDATGDALLLMSILAAAKGRLDLYAIACTLLCLCRESYAAPAAVVWLLTVSGHLRWRELKVLKAGSAEQAQTPVSGGSYLLRVSGASIPGAVVLAWAWYVSYRTESGMLSGARSIPWGGLIDWPFFAYVKCFIADLQMGRIHRDIFYTTSCAIVIAMVLWRIVYESKTDRRWLPLACHVLLMAMTGSIVWEASVGYFKNTASVVLIGILLLPKTPSKSLRVALCFCFALSFHYLYRSDFHRMKQYPPLEVNGSTIANGNHEVANENGGVLLANAGRGRKRIDLAFERLIVVQTR